MSNAVHDSTRNISCSVLFFCLPRLRQLTRDHVRQNEVHTENINSTNRPSELERKYENFCAYQRFDFTEFLKIARRTNSKDKWTQEYMDTYVACIIFEVYVCVD